MNGSTTWSSLDQSSGWIIATDHQAAAKTQAALDGNGTKWRAFVNPGPTTIQVSSSHYPASVVVVDMTGLRSLGAMREYLGWLNLEAPVVGLVNADHRPNMGALVGAGAHEIVVANGDATALREAVKRASSHPNGGGALRKANTRMWQIFERSPIAYWIEDFSELDTWLDNLRTQGITNLAEWLEENPEEIETGISKIRILDVNPAALRLSGATSKAELLENGLSAIDTGDSHDVFREQLLAVWEGRDQLRTMGTGRTADGSRMDYTLSWVAVRDGEPGDSTVIVAMEDITELAAARRRMQHLSDLKDRFIASITHELRTPLTAVVGFANLLRESYDTATPVEMDEFLDLLGSAAEEGGAILENLLVAVDLDDAGQTGSLPSPKTTEVDLMSAAARAIKSLAPDVRALVTVVPGSVIARANSSRVQQI
nr:histidine kinase dimerization/phospho-acceptor domain-containing protein [Acidimicrobiia bacterium]